MTPRVYVRTQVYVEWTGLAVPFLSDCEEHVALTWRAGVVAALVRAGVARDEAELRGDELLDELRAGRLVWRGDAKGTVS